MPSEINIEDEPDLPKTSLRQDTLKHVQECSVHAGYSTDARYVRSAHRIETDLGVNVGDLLDRAPLA